MKRLFILAIIAVLFALNGCAHIRGTLHKAPRHERKVSFKARDHFLQGLYYQQEGLYNEALVEYYQALHFDSTSATIYRTIGENYMRLGHFDSAEIMLRKALYLDRQNPRTLNLLAECELRLGSEDKAIRYYEALLKVNPYDNDARQLLILLYEKKGRDLDVARHNRILMQLYGKNKSLLFKMVQIYVKNKQYNLAQKNCRAILQLDSTDARSYFLLGLIKEQKLQPDSSIFYYEKSLHFNPKFTQALDRLSFLSQTKREWQKLIPFLKRTIKADTSYTPAKIYLAESYFYLNRNDSARSILLPLVNKPNIPLGVFELLGRIELQSKNYDAAQKYLKKILVKDDKNKMAWLLLAFTYSDMDSLDRAETTYKKLTELFPKDAMVWSFYGNLLQNRKKYAPAINAFQKAVKIQPDNESALSGLAIIYENLKQFARCDSVYELAIKRLPDNALLLNNYSYSLAERNIHLKKALEMAKKAITLIPNNAAYLDTYGWVLYKLGKYKKAAEFIKKSIELRANSSVVIGHLGDVYKAIGNREKALMYYQKALDLEPDNKTLKKKIEEIKE